MKRKEKRRKIKAFNVIIFGGFFADKYLCLIFHGTQRHHAQWKSYNNVLGDETQQQQQTTPAPPIRFTNNLSY